MDETVREEEWDLGLVGRMVKVFTAPSETFEAVRQRRTWLDWFAPVILVAIVSLVATQQAMPLFQEMQDEAMEEQLQDMPEEQRQQALEVARGAGLISTLVMVPIGTFAALFILAGLLLLLSNFILGGSGTYGQMLAVWGYSCLIGIPSWIVRLPLMLSTESATVYLGPGALLSEEALGTFLGKVVAGIDLFTFWQLCVAAIGMAVVAGFATRRSLIALLVIWALWIIAKAGLAGLTGMPIM